MNTYSIRFFGVLISGLFLIPLVYAQSSPSSSAPSSAHPQTGESGHDHSAHGKSGEYMDHGTEPVCGEIRRIARSTKKLLIQHDPIKPVDMPAMTMTFTVQDKDVGILDKVKKGDRVCFMVINVNGRATIADLKKKS